MAKLHPRCRCASRCSDDRAGQRGLASDSLGTQSQVMTLSRLVGARAHARGGLQNQRPAALPPQCHISCQTEDAESWGSFQRRRCQGPRHQQIRSPRPTCLRRRLLHWKISRWANSTRLCEDTRLRLIFVGARGNQSCPLQLAVVASMRLDDLRRRKLSRPQTI